MTFSCRHSHDRIRKKEVMRMPLDYKKEYKEFYLPKNQPELIEIPSMNFAAVRGKGDPNEVNGNYRKALEILYGISYTIKMSYKGSHQMQGYFEYVVPPLEGFWWMEGKAGVDYQHKSDFCWISVIRLPEFVTKEEFDWAVKELAAKKYMDTSKAEYFTYQEGLCVQCMHLGSYDTEPPTTQRMEEFAREIGYQIDITDSRYHHEIYLSDARRCAPENLKTVIRHPVKKVEEEYTCSIRKE